MSISNYVNKVILKYGKVQPSVLIYLLISLLLTLLWVYIM